MDCFTAGDSLHGQERILQLLLAGAYLRALRVEEALRIYANMLREFPGDADVQFILAELSRCIDVQEDGCFSSAAIEPFASRLIDYCQDAAHQQEIFAVVERAEKALPCCTRQPAFRQDLLPVLSVLIDDHARQASAEGSSEQADVLRSLRHHIARSL